jgi:signal transduction histidine kinase
MRLVTKINTALGGLIGLSVALNFAALEFTVAPGFAALEEQMARANHERVLEAVSSLEERVRGSARDYAAWDDTYAFMAGGQEDYLDKNINPEALAALDVNFFVIVDNSGKIVVNEGWLYAGDEPVPARLLDAPALDPALLQAVGGEEPGDGLLQTAHGLAAVGYSQVLRSDLSGNSPGMLLLGSLIDMEALQNTTKVSFRIDPPAAAQPAAGEEVMLASDDGAVRTSSTLAGLTGSAVGQLESTTPRAISRLGQNTIWAALGLIVAAGIATLIALAVLLRKIAVTRIERMRAHLTEVGATGALAPMPDDSSGDELSDVTRSYNDMAAQLAELRERIRQQDYREGAADHAAGLLHNVRNGLNPVGAAAWSLANAESAPWKDNLRKALSELKADAPDPERVRKLQGFVALSAERMLAEGDQRKRELEGMRDMLRQLEEVLTPEDSLSRNDRAREPVDMAAAIRNAARLVEARATGAKIEVDAPAEIPAALGSDVTLRQVFGNLFVNAAESIEATGRGSGRIRVTARETTHRGAPALDIAVSDDGEGIDPGQIDRIFEKGFSTRRRRSGGLGLHWSANVVNAMGGRIQAESGGIGRGATLHVVLPRAAATIADAA